ncbi:hypothetical protein EE612_018653, partial [Oryza sativa]
SWAISVPVPSSSRRLLGVLGVSHPGGDRGGHLCARPSLPSRRRPFSPKLPPLSLSRHSCRPPSHQRAHLQHGGSASGAEANGEGDGGAAMELQRSGTERKKEKKGEKGGGGREKEGRREK